MSDDLSPQSYLVWYDPFFEEWFACPEAEVTRTVLSCLSQIHVVPKKMALLALRVGFRLTH